MSLPSGALYLVRRLPIFLFCLVLLPSFSLRAFFHIMGHFSCTLLTWQNKTLRSRYMPPTDAALPGPPVSLSLSLSYSCLGGYAALGFVGPTSSASIGCFCPHVFPSLIRAPQNVEKKSRKRQIGWLSLFGHGVPTFARMFISSLFPLFKHTCPSLVTLSRHCSFRSDTQIRTASLLTEFLTIFTASHT